MDTIKGCLYETQIVMEPDRIIDSEYYIIIILLTEYRKIVEEKSA